MGDLGHRDRVVEREPRVLSRWQLRSGRAGRARIAIKFVAASTSGSPVSYFAGTVNVKQIQTGVKVGGVDMVKFTFQGTGELDITWA